MFFKDFSVGQISGVRRELGVEQNSKEPIAVVEAESDDNLN